MTTSNTPQLLTKTELAQFLKLKPRGVEALAKSGRIPKLAISRRCVRFDLQKVMAALNRFEVKEVR